MSDMSQNFQEGQARLARDLRVVVDDAEALLRQTVRDAGQGYGEARARLEQSLQTAKTELASAERAVLDTVAKAGRSTDDYVRKHPWESIAVGAGVGLLLGLLIGRR
jgi:ElaB/YqjD/DUF883 family membrane-anchored ribosome-binding protein